MKYELLEYLKFYSDANLLRYYGGDRGKSSDRDIYKSICGGLAQISSFIEQYSKKPQVFLAEADPIRFLTVFLAGVIAEVDLFLGDPAWQQQEWGQVLEIVKPDLVYGDRSTRDLIAKLGSTIEDAAPSRSDLPEQLIMIPTGGTSGKIRFAIHTWDTLAASVTGFKDYFGCQKINSFCTLPLYHVSGLMQLMRSLLTQGELFICPYKTVKTKQITLDRQDYFISLVPTQLQFLIQFPDWLTQFKVVLLGGAPPMRSLLDTAREYNIPVALTYGMTETASGVVVLKPQDFLTGNNSSGRVLPHAKVAIAPEDNQIGLIKISGNSVCLGYYPQLFASDRLVTDDLGYFDDLGYLYLVGRNSQKIITGGENVFPVEVESAIYSTRLVKDVCVVGIEDRHWGEVVTAIYVPADPKTNLDLIKHKIQLQLAKYKQPKNWIEVDSLPRNDRGKINYQKIKAIAERAISFERQNNHKQ